jgi:hypothetical protein
MQLNQIRLLDRERGSNWAGVRALGRICWLGTKISCFELELKRASNKWFLTWKTVQQVFPQTYPGPVQRKSKESLAQQCGKGCSLSPFLAYLGRGGEGVTPVADRLLGKYPKGVSKSCQGQSQSCPRELADSNSLWEQPGTQGQGCSGINSPVILWNYISLYFKQSICSWFKQLHYNQSPSAFFLFMVDKYHLIQMVWAKGKDLVTKWWTLGHLAPPDIFLGTSANMWVQTLVQPLPTCSLEQLHLCKVVSYVK